MEIINYFLNENEKEILLNYFISQKKPKPNSKKNYIEFINLFLEKHDLKYSKKDVFIDGKRQVQVDEFYSKDIQFNLMWNDKKTFFEHLISLNHPLSNTRFKAYSRFNPDWKKIDDKGNNILHQIALNPFHHRIMEEILKELNFDPNSLNFQGESYHVLFFKNCIIPLPSNNADVFMGAIECDLIIKTLKAFQKDNISQYLSPNTLNNLINNCEVIPSKLIDWLDSKKNLNSDFFITEIKDFEYTINFLKLTNSLSEKAKNKIKAKI